MSCGPARRLHRTRACSRGGATVARHALRCQHEKPPAVLCAAPRCPASRGRWARPPCPVAETAVYGSGRADQRPGGASLRAPGRTFPVSRRPQVLAHNIVRGCIRGSLASPHLLRDGLGHKDAEDHSLRSFLYILNLVPCTLP
jgi:hypothetical protein